MCPATLLVVHVVCGLLACFSHIHFLPFLCSALDYKGLNPEKFSGLLNLCLPPPSGHLGQQQEIDRRKAETRVFPPLTVWAATSAVVVSPLWFQSCWNAGCQTLVIPFSLPWALQPRQQGLFGSSVALVNLEIADLSPFGFYALPSILVFVFLFWTWFGLVLCQLLHHFFYF